MANWQDPRPLFPWSAPPDQQGPRTAPKIKPNIYARMARVSVQHPVAVLLLLIFAAATAATVVLLTLRVDFAKSMLPEESAVERRASSDLASRFGDIETLLRVRLASDAPGTTITAARDLFTRLQSQPELFRKVLLPELQPTVNRLSPFYLDTPELNRRAGAIRSAQAYYQLLAASPTLGGLNGVLATAKGAADAGTAPANLAMLLGSLSTVATDLVAAKATMVDWNVATGFSVPPALPEVTLLVLPEPGKSMEALAQLQTEVDKIQSANVTIRTQVEAAGDDGVSTRPASTGRQFIVALCLALLFLVSLFAICFRSPRDVVLVLLPAAAGPLMAVATSTFLDTPLDAVSATLPILLVPGCVVIALCYVLALGRHEKRAISTMSLIMLAAQQSGAVAVAMLALGSVIWVAWLVLGPAGSPALAIGALIGHLVALLVAYMALPTFAALVPRQKPEFIPAAAAQSSQNRVMAGNWLKLRPVLAIAVVALSVASILVLFLHEGLSRNNAALRPLHLQVNGREAAADAVGKLRAEENVGRIVWVDDFLPSDIDAKRTLLTTLAGTNLPAQATSNTPDSLMAEQFQQIDQTLRLLAASPQEGGSLQAAATRLRRSLALLANAQGGAVDAGRKFEQVMAESMRQLTPYMAELATLQPPATVDLDPALRSLFIANDGTYRVEVWPRPPVDEQSFSATVRAIDSSAVFAADAAGSGLPVPWRFVIALIVACVSILGVSLIILGEIYSALQFMVAQLCTLLVFGAGARLLGIGPAGLVEVATFAGLGASAMAGLWVRLTARHAWMTPWSMLLGPLAAAAVTLPLLLLSIHELAGFAQALILFIITIMLVQTTLPPQLQDWFAGRNFLDRILRQRTGLRNAKTRNSQLSTSDTSDAKTPANAEAGQPPGPSL